MFDLPSSVSTEKDKIEISPVFVIDFPDIPFTVSTRQIDWIITDDIDGSTDGTGIFTDSDATFQTDDVRVGDILEFNNTRYTITAVNSETTLEFDGSPAAESNITYTIYRSMDDLIQKDADININSSLVDTIDKYPAISSGTLILLGWRETLRDDLIGSSPDLTDQTVNIYFTLYDTGLDGSDYLLLFSGVVADWSEKNDKMMITIKDADDTLQSYTGTALKDTYTYYEQIPDDYIAPKQYGDFAYNVDEGYYWAEVIGRLAICPFTGKDDINSDYRFIVADHEMHNMPTDAELYQSKDYDPFLFFINNHTLIAFGIESVTTTNAASGANVTFSNIYGANRAGRALLAAQDEFDTSRLGDPDNQVADWADAVDGKSTTFVTVDGSDESILSVTDFRAEQKISNISLNNSDMPVQLQALLIVQLGTVSPNGTNTIKLKIFKKSTYTYLLDVELTSSQSNTTVKKYIDIDSSTDVDDWAVVVECNDASATCEVKNIVLMPEVNVDLTQITEFYLRCQGREYSSTWDSRKTSGNLIENISDAIESIIRDEIGSTNINTDTFDQVHNSLSAVKINMSIYRRQLWYDFLKTLISKFNLSLRVNTVGKYSLLFPDADYLKFSSSGTDTPGNEDIFTDSDSLSNEYYQQHPIQKKSFEIKRTSRDNIKTKITVKYAKTGDEYLKEYSSGSGNKELMIEQDYIGDDTSAQTLASRIRDFRSQQKSLISFITFHNAIAVEVGDVINVRHTELSNNMLFSGSKNSQKWMVLKTSVNYHPARVQITALEMP